MELTPAEIVSRMYAGESFPAERAEIEKFFHELSTEFASVARERMEMAIQMGERPACRGKGCSWCCYDAALISPVESLILMWALEEKPIHERILIKRQLARWKVVHEATNSEVPFQTGSADQASEEWQDMAQATVAKSVVTSMKYRTPCPFLLDGACSVYKSRPFACRGHHSLNATPDDCRDKNLGLTSVKSIDLLPLMLYVIQEISRNRLPALPAGELPTMLWHLLSSQGDLELMAALRYEDARSPRI